MKGLLLYGPGYFIVGGLTLFFITMLGTSFYAFLWWDMDAWHNVILWLNPEHNVFVRMVSIAGLCLAEFGGLIVYEIGG